jgi:hypothetical protein
MNLLSQISQSDFMPHGHCYFWQPDVLWLHVGSNAVIALAYVLIPVALIILILKNKFKLPHKDLLYLSVAFISLCGMTHLMEIYTTWIPAYRLEGWLKAMTASVSLITALVLLPKLPELIESQELQKKYDLLREHQATIEARLNQMNSVYEASLGREERIVQLKRELNQELVKQGLPLRYRIHD